MPDEASSPATVPLLPEETEPAIALGVYEAVLDGEALGNGCLHSGNGAGGFGVDVSGKTMASMHDEGSVVHASLRGGDEVEIWGSTGPSGVDESVGMEGGFEVLPFTGISANKVMSVSSTCDVDDPLRDM